MNCTSLIINGIVAFICIACTSNALCDEYELVNISTESIVYESPYEFIGIDNITDDLCVVCFRTPINLITAPSLHFTLLNRVTNASVASFEICNAYSYKIHMSLNDGLISIVHSFEGSSGTYVIDRSGNCVYNYPDNEIYVVSNEIIGVRNYSPIHDNLALGVNTTHSVLLSTGVFSNCSWNNADESIQISFMNNELIILLLSANEGRQSNYVNEMIAYDINCNKLWSVRRKALQFKAYGNYLGNTLGVLVSYNGSEIIDIRTGLTTILSPKTIFTPVICESGIYYCGQLREDDEYAICKIGSVNDNPEVIAPYYHNQQPRRLLYDAGVLYAIYDDGCGNAFTGILSSNSDDFIIVPGLWRVSRQNENGMALMGGAVNGSTLSCGHVDNN